MARKSSTIIRYDGAALQDHEMDVHFLAPALLALGDLCKIANEALNGDISAVKVLVRADIEQRCFQVQVELVQTLFERLTTIVELDYVKDAKSILEWLGIITGAGVAGGGGLFALYKFLSQKKPTDTVSVTHNNSDGSVTFIINGGSNTFTVPQEVERIAQHPATLRNMRALVAPLAEEGYETLEFERNGQTESLFTKDEAKKIIELARTELTFDREDEVTSVFRASVKVRKAIMEGDASWGINYRSAVDAKMLDREWLERYQNGEIMLLPGSKLIVEMREIVQLDENRLEVGKPNYEILKVIGVELPPEQYNLLQ
jgi:hypothetical protein